MIRHFDAPDGTRLAYRDEGAGLPVLCLSGLTRNSTDFDYVAPHLADVRLIRLDYRGRGASDWADPATYTFPVEAGDALALLDHLGIDRAPILGTSRGGIIGMFLGATAPERLMGVCLNDIGPEVDPRGLKVIAQFVGRNPGVQTYDEAARVRARIMEGFVGVPESRWMEEARKHFIETPEGLAINYDPDLARIFDTPAAEDGPAPDLWGAFDTLAGLPLAVIRGENSDLLAPEVLDEMRRRRPDAHVAVVPGRGHVPFLDEPEAVAAIRAWIEEMK